LLDVLTPLPISSSDSNSNNRDTRSSSVVVIRSLSNKTSFDSPDDFYRQMHESVASSDSPNMFHRRHSSTPETSTVGNSSFSSVLPSLINFADSHQFSPVPACTKTQISCSTNESDDDGYGSLSSSNRTLSISSSSISSELFEATAADQQRDDSASK
jgi:hypothetical protein